MNASEKKAQNTARQRKAEPKYNHKKELSVSHNKEFKKRY